MANHNDRGREAEALARKTLEGKGYKIIDLNWYYGHKEIDIIAGFDKKLIIAEVKSCSESDYISPSELLSTKKMKHLTTAAEAYIWKNRLMIEVRFDLVVVVFGMKTISIEHIEEAFTPGVNW